MDAIAESRYGELESTKDSYVQTAYDASELTIPSLFPRERSTRRLATPFQGIGARGVNNLASKLLLALVPPNSPFFRLKIDESTLAELSEDPAVKTQVEKSLATIERSVMGEIETSGDRIKLFEALKQLIVVGSVLIYIDSVTETIRVYQLDKFVVKRDPNGQVIEAVVREWVSPDSVPESIRGQVNAAAKETEEKTVAMFTHIKRRDDKFMVHQEVKGVVVPKSKGTFPVDKSPWLFLRFTQVDGEDYGRSFVEEYYGDLHSLEKLTKAIVEGSAAAAKVLFLTDPNGTTRARTLAESPNGAIREGSMRDITVLQLDKYADFRVTLDTMQRIEERLSYAFMLNSSVQRKGERVTAEEIKYMAGELEDTLGGVYSLLSQELQLPYVNRRMAIMERKGRLPSLPKDTIKPAIVTGMEALGRGQDLRKLDLFIGGIRETLGDEALQKYVNVGDYISRRATAVGLDTDGLIRSDEELQQEEQKQLKAQQEAQQQEMLKSAIPPGIGAASNLMQEGMKQNGGTQEGTAVQG